MRPRGVHHVSINVSNPEHSIAFYTDVLGGVVRSDRPDFGFGGAWIDLGSAQTFLADLDGNLIELHQIGAATSP